MMRYFLPVLMGVLLTGCWLDKWRTPTNDHSDVGTQAESSAESPREQIALKAGEQHFYVEVARTAPERELGLMHRASLSANQGMLFVWPEAGGRNFWMKNTLIPLDMIWLDADKKIVDIQAAEPCKVANCPIYSGKAPAQYVLELNQGVLRAPLGTVVNF